MRQVITRHAVTPGWSAIRKLSRNGRGVPEADFWIVRLRGSTSGSLVILNLKPPGRFLQLSALFLASGVAAVSFIFARVLWV